MARAVLAVAVAALAGVSGAQPAAAATPTIAHFSPARGTVGATVTLFGSGFASDDVVSFGGVPATTSLLGDRRISAVVPMGAVTGTISVSGASGSGASSSPFLVAPKITDFSPDHGKPKTEVRIFGSAFTGTTRVAFNGRAASFTVESYGVLRATIPARTTSGAVRVTTGAGTAVSPFPFSVTGPVLVASPTTLRPHARLTLTGRGFQPNEPVRVTMDGSPFATADADIHGSVSLVVRLPSDLSPLDYTLDMIGALSGNDALAVITIDEPWSKFHSDNANSGYQPYENSISIFNASTLVQA